MDSRNIFLAMTETDSAKRQVHIDREMLRLAVSMTITCPYCGAVLDVHTSYNFEIHCNGRQVMDKTICGDCGEKAERNLPVILAEAQKLGTLTVTIIKGVTL